MEAQLVLDTVGDEVEVEIPVEKLKPFFHEKKRQSYDDRFKGQLVAVVTKTYIWFSPDVREFLNLSHVQVVQAKQTWGVTPSEAKPGAYSLDKQNGHERASISCQTFLDAAKMPAGYFFKGVIREGSVVFSKTPTGRA